MVKLSMNLDKLILEQIDDSQNKTLLEVGSHDDELTMKLAQHLKKIYSYYEYVKIPERAEGNIEIKKLPYVEVMKQLEKFDVILMVNEFHHFPDIWQKQTFEKLNKNQQLFLIEWDFSGNNDYFHQAFQDCGPLCKITKNILDKAVENKVIKINNKITSKYETTFGSKEEMINHFKFILPDHYPFGEKEFLEKIKDLKFPFVMWEGFDLYLINKFV